MLTLTLTLACTLTLTLALTRPRTPERACEVPFAAKGQEGSPGRGPKQRLAVRGGSPARHYTTPTPCIYAFGPRLVIRMYTPRAVYLIFGFVERGVCVRAWSQGASWRRMCGSWPGWVSCLGLMVLSVTPGSLFSRRLERDFTHTGVCTQRLKMWSVGGHGSSREGLGHSSTLSGTGTDGAKRERYFGETGGGTRRSSEEVTRGRDDATLSSQVKDSGRDPRYEPSSFDTHSFRCEAESFFRFSFRRL